MFMLTYQYADDIEVEPIVIGVSSTISGAKTYAVETMGYKNCVWSEMNLAGEVAGKTPAGICLVIEPVKVLDSNLEEKE